MLFPTYINEENRNKWTMPATFSYYFAMMALGFIGSIFGAILPYLIEKTNSGASQISYMFLFQGSGFILASMTLGKKFDTFPGNKLLSFVVFCLIGCLFFIDKINRIWMVCLLVFVFGICVCLINIGVNTLMQWLHGQKMGPYLNVVHVFYAIGCIVTPLLLANAFQTGEEIGQALKSLLVILGIIGIYVFLIPSPYPVIAAPADTTNEPAKIETEKLLPVFLGLFLFFALGSQTTSYSWITSTVLYHFQTSEATAARFTSIFWVGILLGRIVSSRFVTNRNVYKYILFSIAACGLFGAAMIFQSSLVIYAILFFMCGFAVGPIYANAFVYLQTKTYITGKMNGTIFAIYQLGIMFIPWLTGHLVETFDYGITMIIITISYTVSLLILVMLEKRYPSNLISTNKQS